MHDVLDPRDLVPDEAEQLSLSGYDVGDLVEDARAAAAASDGPRLLEIERALAETPRSLGWGYDEPDDDASMEELFAALDPVAYDASALPDRIRGAWLGRAVGNTLGKPVEGLTRGELDIYLRAAGQSPMTGYLPLLDPLPEGVSALHPSASEAAAGRFSTVPRDDDLDWTILGLYLVEEYGRGLTTEQVAVEWLDRVPFTQTFTAERAAYRNLVGGLTPPETATHRNPYREWIGALIRGDAFGYVNPGDPAAAARLACVDARLTHTANGLYGEVWSAALVACALATGSAETAVRRAMDAVPPRSRLSEALRGVLDLAGEGATSTAALDWVDAELGHYPWVHTINNAALIAVGLLWGETFIDAVGITISGGRDTDSNGATVGSVYGALHGAAAVPEHLVGITHVHVRSAVRDFDRITIAELTARTLRLVTPLEESGRS